ncbi:NAD(P)/FAD-dependent oxidoreductase [Polymorphospora lycopeni]|uniref:FAD-dependent oxidoreductase n=1 Tax=Polymorphospora lycopeni TaxID=3140240 RepID=A0ABV5CQF9_9ACTN
MTSSGPGHPDVVVVGNGALGLFLARALVGAGVTKVAVAGPPARPGAASTAAGAMLGSFGEVTKDTFGTAAGRAKFDLGLAAHELWPDVLAELAVLAEEAGERLHRVADTHVVLNGCGGPLDTVNYAAIVTALGTYVPRWREVDGADIPGYQPRPDGRALRCLLIPGEGAIDGNQVIRLMDRHLAASGVRYHPRAVRRLLVRHGRVAGVQFDDDETLTAGVVVVAAGARTAELLRTALGPTEVQPMLAGTGTAVVLDRTAGRPFETVVRTPNRGGACGLHLIPLGGDREYVGASNLLASAPRLKGTVGTTAAILQQVARQLDEGASGHEIAEWRVGNRPVALDGFPLVGWTSVPGLYALSGTYRDGLHAAPALAGHVTAEITGGKVTLDLPFAPGREPVSTLTVEESIDEYALHMTSLWFELGGHAPSQLPTAALTGWYRDEARQVYRRTGITLGLNPDVLCHLVTPGGRSALPGLLRYLRDKGHTQTPSRASAGPGTEPQEWT